MCTFVLKSCTPLYLCVSQVLVLVCCGDSQKTLNLVCCIPCVVFVCGTRYHSATHLKSALVSACCFVKVDWPLGLKTGCFIVEVVVEVVDADVDDSEVQKISDN